MAVQIVEGFDHMIAALVAAKGWSQNPTSVVAGRFAGQAARLAAGTMAKALPSPVSELHVGFAFRYTTATTTDICVLRDAGSVNEFRIGGLLSSGAMILRLLNSAGTVIATGTSVIPASTWVYIEAHAKIAGASGVGGLHLNGAVEIADTTGNFGSNNIASFGFVGAGVSDIDDVYLLDTTGAAPRNSYLGDVRVETLYPSADGTHTQFTPNSGTAHFSRVNEHTGTFPDGDTTYVADATVGDIDSYGVDDLSFSAGTIFAVQTNIYARKDDVAARQIADVVRQGGSDTVGATKTIGATYAFYSQLRNQDPAAADWSIANVNADEFGVKVIS